MATLMAYGGNFTDASSWGLCSSIAAHDSESSNTVVTTSYLSGADFMPGAITIDGIAVKPRSITPNTGNITVALQSSGLIISGTVVTLNISNLPSGIGATSAPDYGWILFRFTGNQTLTDGLNYKVQARTSNASIVTLYSSGTNNWARQLRTTTNSTTTTFGLFEPRYGKSPSSKEERSTLERWGKVPRVTDCVKGPDGNAEDKLEMPPCLIFI
jgi:hypothetical protein